MRVLQLELTLELGIDDYVPHRCSHSKELRAVTRFWSCLAHGLSGRNFEVFSSQHQRRFTAKLTDRIPRSSTSEFCPIVTKFCDSVPSPRSSFLSSRSSVTSSSFSSRQHRRPDLSCSDLPRFVDEIFPVFIRQIFPVFIRQIFPVFIRQIFPVFIRQIFPVQIYNIRRLRSSPWVRSDLFVSATRVLWLWIRSSPVARRPVLVTYPEELVLRKRQFQL
jgi:hypothetical protein